MSKRKLISVGVVCLLLVAVSGFASVPLNDLERQAKAREAKIQDLIKAGKLDQAFNETLSFERWLKPYGHRLDDYIVRNYDNRALIQEKKGLYEDAANTIRTSHAWKRNPQNIQKVMNYEQKNSMQREYYQLKLENFTTRLSKGKEVLELAQQKEKLVKEFLTKKDIKKEDLEKLQAQIKDLNNKIAAINKEVSEINKKFQEAIQKYIKEGIIFNANQETKLNEKARELSEVQLAIFKANQNAQKGLTEIVEKYKWGWEGLEETLTKMQKVQDTIMGIHKKMLEIMAKQPLTDADKKALLDYKSQLDKLMSEHANLMEDIEKGFMDAKIFSQLTPEQKEKYFKIFQVIREAATAIEATNKKINEFIAQMNVKYGDLNKDGKIDKIDLEIMAKYLQPTERYLHIVRPTPYLKEADLDGDGMITWADYSLLNSAVNGNRKTFPVDPENKKGDLTGDGSFGFDDLEMLVRIIRYPQAYPGAWQKVADANGDGKVDINDMTTLIKLLEQPSPKASEPTTSAAAEQQVLQGENTSQTTGATGKAGSDTSSSQGAPASGIDSAY